jgi:hypothetical protein
MVIALIALFVSLGGTAAALSGSNTVFSDDIVDNQVFSADVRNDTLSGGGLGAADLQPNSVGTSEAVNNSLTGADVNEGTLSLPAGAFREVGAAGQPAFNSSGFCAWKNFEPSAHSTAAFVRDRFGFVHLKGLVDADDGTSPGCAFLNNTSPTEDELIFNLPAGYRPAKRSAFATITNGAFGRVTVDGASFDPGLGAGAVFVDTPTTEANAKVWISLDGITFRCAPSGADGCP